MWTPDRFESIEPSFRGVRYRRESLRGIRPLVDVYMPEGQGPFPSVILIHGGAFLVGSRDMKPARYLASNLVKAGFVVASMDYRMVWRGGRFNESRNDVEAMIRWWFSQGSTYAIDPDRVSLLGISAGAALMLMARTAAATPSVAKIVSVYGIYDFEHLSGAGIRFMRKRLFKGNGPAIWRDHSPLCRYEGAEPILFVHGTADQVVPVAQADAFVEKREKAGLPVAYFRGHGAPHGFFNQADSRSASEGLRAILDFLRSP